MKRVWITPSGQIDSLYQDMLNQTHLLIAGCTGSGKSIALQGVIYTALYKSPSTNQFILIDPKKVNLKKFRDLPHTIIHATTKEQIIKALENTVDMMDNRFTEMERKNIEDYDGSNVYVCFDEIMNIITSYGKHTRDMIQYLLQVGRAAKVHCIICTQSPIREVLPTYLKCNIDSRLGLRTRSKQDSRNILDVSGCETLPQYGYGYYMTPKQFKLYQIPLIEPVEIKRLIDHWLKHKKPKLQWFGKG